MKSPDIDQKYKPHFVSYLFGEDPGYLGYLKYVLELSQNPAVQNQECEIFLVVDERAANMLQSYKVGDWPQDNAYQLLGEKGVTIVRTNELFTRLENIFRQILESQGISLESAKSRAEDFVKSVSQTYERMRSEEFEGKKIFPTSQLVDFLKGVVGSIGLTYKFKDSVVIYHDLDLKFAQLGQSFFDEVRERFDQGVNIAFVGAITLTEKVFEQYKKLIGNLDPSTRPLFKILQEGIKQGRYLTFHYTTDDQAGANMQPLRSMLYVARETDLIYSLVGNPYLLKGARVFMEKLDYLVAKFKTNQNADDLIQASSDLMLSIPFEEAWEAHKTIYGYEYTVEAQNRDGCTIFAADEVALSRGHRGTWVGEQLKEFIDIRVPSLVMQGKDNVWLMCMMMFNSLYVEPQLAITMVEEAAKMASSVASSEVQEEENPGSWSPLVVPIAVAVVSVAALISGGQAIYNKYFRGDAGKKNDDPEQGNQNSNPKTGAGR